MTDILCFSRNNATTVEQLDQDTLVSSCRLQDTLMDLLVAIRVKTPDLEIMDIQAEIRRSSEAEIPDIHKTLKKVIGVRVGPGIKKIVKGLIGKSTTEKKLVFHDRRVLQWNHSLFYETGPRQGARGHTGRKGVFRRYGEEQPSSLQQLRGPFIG